MRRCFPVTGMAFPSRHWATLGSHNEAGMLAWYGAHSQWTCDVFMALAS